MNVAVADSTSVVLMSRDEAEHTLARIKANLEDVRALLFELRDREGWRALGYATWHDCVNREFNMSRQRAHQLLTAHMVDRILANTLPGPASTRVDAGPISERVARELAPLVDQPERVVAVVNELRETPVATVAAMAKNARKIVDRELARPSTPKPERRSVSSKAEAGDFADLPDDQAFPFNNETADLADGAAAGDDIVGRAPNEPRFCSECGDHYRGAACPCKTTAVDDTGATGEAVQADLLSPSRTTSHTIGKPSGIGQRSLMSSPVVARPVFVDGKAPVGVYPSADGFLNGIDSHLSYGEQVRLHGLLTDYLRGAAQRQALSGAAV